MQGKRLERVNQLIKEEVSAVLQVRHADQPIASGQRQNTTRSVDELGLREPF